MTLFVICAVGVALLCAVAVLLLIRIARHRAGPGSAVPHYVVPHTPVRPSTRTPTRPPSGQAPPPAPSQQTAAPAGAPPAAARPATPGVPAPQASPPTSPPAAPAPTAQAPAAPPSWEDEPYGTGSAHPLPDGSAPSTEYTVKGDPDEMRYFTIDSPDFEHVRAEVWFRTERDAQKAGFTSSEA